MTPDYQVEMWPLGRLSPYVRNPRKNDHVVDQMVSSIREFGFKIPVLARSSGEIVDGHLRLKAAHKLNLPEVPVVLCDEWTDAQVKAFRLLVNKSVEWADWDAELLNLELADLKEINFDLSLTGFDGAESQGLLDQTWEPPDRESQKPSNPAVPDFLPSTEAEQGRLDEKRKITCPECGHEFAQA